MNNIQKRVLQIVNEAKDSIYVAVSWFTDEAILNALINKSGKLDVRILVSADELNILRYREFRNLQLQGGKVLKVGSTEATQGRFMHSKFIVVDACRAYTGSFNFTSNATTNYENFNEVSSGEVQELDQSFSNWCAQAVDFFAGIEDPEKIVRKVLAEFKENKSRSRINNVYTENQRNSFFLSHSRPKTIVREVTRSQEEAETASKILDEELKKETLRQTAMGLATGTHTVSKSGEVASSGEGVKVKPHRHYGGKAPSFAYSSKKQGSYARCYCQKKFVESTFSFLRAKIINDVLIVRGTIQVPDCGLYEIKIESADGYFPRTYIVSPKIEPEGEIHMFTDGSLCLFYPTDHKWNASNTVASLLIPWVIEWIYYYELWKITGVWEGKEVMH